MRKAMKLCALALALSFGIASLLSLSARAETVAIVGGTAYTMTGDDPVENATIIIRDGRIDAVGAGLAPPADARVIDAKGRIITPGLMAGGTQLGLLEVGAAENSVDTSSNMDTLGAAFDVQYAINPNSTLIDLARADGLTRAMSFPGSAAAPFSGLGAIIRLDSGADIVERAKAGMFARSGGGHASAVGGSRSGGWVLLRNALDEARRYKKRSGPGAPRDQLLNHLDAEALQPVLKRAVPLAIWAERESDIRQAVRLGRDYDISVIIMGGAEAWRAADLLAASDTPVILDPFVNLPSDFDQIGARLDNAALLQKAGVRIALAASGWGLKISYNAGLGMREAAGIAVANGLPYIEGLRAMTTGSAQIWGIADHYGSIAAGKDADLVIWSGDPLEPMSTVITSFIRGEEMALETRQGLLAKRYAPQHANDAWPAAYK